MVDYGYEIKKFVSTLDNASEINTLNISSLKTNKELLLLCLKNNRYDLGKFFDISLFDDDITKMYEGHFGEYVSYYKSGKLPDSFYCNPVILNEAIDCISIYDLRPFTESSWTEENVLKCVDKYKDSIGTCDSVLRGTGYKSIFKILLKNEIFQITNSYSQNFLDDESVEIVIDLLKKNPDNHKYIRQRNELLLKRLLEEELLVFDEMYKSYSDCWNDENVDLLINLVREDKYPLNSSYVFMGKYNKKMIPLIFEKGEYNLLVKINKENVDDELSYLLVNNFDKVIKKPEDIPYILFNSSILLGEILNRKLDDKYLNRFDIDAWSDENLVALYENYEDNPLKHSINNFKSSEKLAIRTIDLGYSDRLDIFTSIRIPISDELLDKVIEMFKDKSNRPANIPYFLFSDPRVTKRLLMAGEIDLASRIFTSNSWDDEAIELYCSKVALSNDDVEYANTVFFRGENIKRDLILKAYILSNKIEAIKLYTVIQDTSIWTDENISLFRKILPEFYKTYHYIPKILYSDRETLNYFLDNRIKVYYGSFDEKIWDLESFYKYKNFYYDGTYNDKTDFQISNEKIKNPYLRYLFNGDINYSFRYENDRDRLYYTLKTEITSEKNAYNSYLKFIHETCSIKLFLHIRALINEDESKLSDYFDENGLKQNLIEELIFDKDYIDYCLKNGIEIEVSNELKGYLDTVYDTPELLNHITLGRVNVFDYFDSNGPKKELFDFLFNYKGAEFLESFGKKYDALSEEKIYILEKFKFIDNDSLKRKYISYYFNNSDKLTKEKIDIIYLLLKRIESSNSTEIFRFKDSLVDQLLELDNPVSKMDELEKIYLKNNLPNVGKSYLVFKTLHPKFEDRMMQSVNSPILKKSTDFQKDVLIFSDLLRITLGSNNRDFNNYVDSLVEGNKLYRKVKIENISFSELSDSDKEILQKFFTHVEVLYNNTLFGSKDKLSNVESISDLENVKRLLNPKDSLEYELPDRIVSMFCHPLGIDSVLQLEKYRDDVLFKREMFHKRLAYQQDFKLHKGDLIKGINNLKYLSNILQNGGLCKEFLGDNADSDLTPLDADVAMIDKEFNSNSDAISNSIASDYGNTYLVFKNDERFNVTSGDNSSTRSNIRDQRMELFQSGYLSDQHYGIRTGFASTDIDYIITLENPSTIIFDLVRNGTYIPVCNKDGKILFTYEQYRELRNKMSGLSHYGMDKYELGNDVVRSELDGIVESLKDNTLDVENKEKAILKTVGSAIGYKVKNKIDGDITPGSIEIIDTGSTGRGTNVYGDSDFDFIVRVDRDIMFYPEKLKKLKQDIARSLGKEYTNGDFRFKGVKIEGIDKPVDIDMTFVVKTNKVTYATENCIQDRLKSIREQYPIEYDYVIANIIMAKKLFKKFDCYKPKHARDNPQGGLGGVGVENFVLQNGGSLKKACQDFLEKTDGKTLDEVRKIYSINDFGANHLAERLDKYPYDNYINNLSDDGYYKMKFAMKAYLKNNVSIIEDNNSKGVVI